MYTYFYHNEKEAILEDGFKKIVSYQKSFAELHVKHEQKSFPVFICLFFGLQTHIFNL